MKRTIEIEDNLQEYCDTAISELKDCIKEYIEENPEITDICLSNDVDLNRKYISIVDSNVPIFTSEIDAQWYLHKSKLVEAFENSGIDGDSSQNNGTLAIFIFIDQRCWDWWGSIEEQLNSDLSTFQETKGADFNTFIDSLSYLK